LAVKFRILNLTAKMKISKYFSTIKFIDANQNILIPNQSFHYCFTIGPAMSYQQILQKMTNDDFITESDDEIVAMWEGHHMAYHDSTTDQAYMASIHESYNMAMEDSKEASQVLEDTAMEIQWYKDMDESMEPAQDAWARYWHHHPRPGQEVPADQGADASRSTIPTAGAAAASSISIPKATAKAKSIGTSAKAKAPKVEATSSSASPANAMPGGAMPATSDAAASAPRPDGSSRPPEPAIPPRTSRPDAATNQARPAKSNYQTGWRAKMVWMLAMYVNHDWDALEAKIPTLWDQLENHMASRSDAPGKWATKAQKWIQNYHQRKWAMENQGYDPRQPDWARNQ
jgi:hypothetical protein